MNKYWIKDDIVIRKFPDDDITDAPLDVEVVFRGDNIPVNSTRNPATGTYTPPPVVSNTQSKLDQLKIEYSNARSDSDKLNVIAKAVGLVNGS